MSQYCCKHYQQSLQKKTMFQPQFAQTRRIRELARHPAPLFELLEQASLVIWRAIRAKSCVCVLFTYSLLSCMSETMVIEGEMVWREEWCVAYGSGCLGDYSEGIH